MPKIQHGHTLEERRQYAGKIKSVATSFYEGNIWKTKSNRTDVTLVEVWEMGNQVSIHPSRNPFFPVRDPGQKRIWHALATDPNTMSMFRSGREVQTVRGGASPQPKQHPKPLAVPPWAREQDLIGYTSPSPVVVGADLFSLIKQLAANAGAAHPSVYYKDGHATIDHSMRGNIGWEYGPAWKCLFFGHVPKEHQ